MSTKLKIKYLDNLGAFTGSTITDNTDLSTALQDLETALEEIDVNVNDLITLSGVAENSSDLGTFTGSIIADNVSIKAALQSLETDVDAIQSASGISAEATNYGTFTGSTITDNLTAKAIFQELETAIEANTALVNGLEWQDSALDYIIDNTLAPPTEVSGDRYLLSHDGGAPNAAWDGASAGDIVEFNGTIWVATTPTVGMFISVDDETTLLYYWGGSSWSTKAFESTTASTGLTKVGFDIRLAAQAENASGIEVTAAGVIQLNDLGAFTTDGLAEGSTNLYFTEARVRASVLTGIDLTTNGTVAATDSVLVALGYHNANQLDLITLSGVAQGAVDLGTFTGTTIADNVTIKAALQALETSLEEIDVNVNDLITLSGVAENSSDLGTFTGSIIADNVTIKAALQALETDLDAIQTLTGVAAEATDLGTFTGSTISDNVTIKAALQALETAVEAGGAVQQCEEFVLSGTDITNKYVDLANVPTDASCVKLHPVGAPQQRIAVDFNIISNGSDNRRLTWNSAEATVSVGMEAELAASDVLMVSYFA